MDWLQQTIQLREGSNGQPIDATPIVAHVANQLAIHRLPELGGEDNAAMMGWTITHVGTGRKLISDALATGCTRVRVQRLVAWIFQNIAPNSDIWNVTAEDVLEESEAFIRLIRAMGPLGHKLGWEPAKETGDGF